MEDLTNVIAYISFIISIGTVIIGYINRKHIVSKCCGKTYDASIAVEDLSPRRKEPLITA